MTDREKGIKGLECCIEKLDTVTNKTHGFNCAACPYFKRCDTSGYLLGLPLMRDVLALLKAQEPRVMTPEEVMSTGPEDVCGIVEIIEEEHMYGCYMRRYDEGHVELLCDVPNLPERLEKGCARIWTARPTDEQREAARWDE